MYNAHYPYGETRSGTLPTDRRFTGQRSELSVGLIDYGARYYDPALGRFLQADTIVPSPLDPQSLNRYSYCLNNSLRYTDSTGHFAREEIMQYLGASDWTEVLAYFEQGGQMEGWWGWLGVLRQAELGWNVYMWDHAKGVLDQPADITMTFQERDGRLWLMADSEGVHIEMNALFGGRLVGREGAYSIDGYYFGSGQQVLHPTYDLSRVDWVGICLDAGGIVADLFTVGVGGRFVNAAELKRAGSALGKVTDLAGLAWDWGPWATTYTTEGLAVDPVTIGLALDVAGMVSPVPFWADAASIVVGLSEGYRREP